MLDGSWSNPSSRYQIVAWSWSYPTERLPLLEALAELRWQTMLRIDSDLNQKAVGAQRVIVLTD